ncbi:hypothetical protein CCP2SC5_250009 [Azospirillaceae bacterium]
MFPTVSKNVPTSGRIALPSLTLLSKNETTPEIEFPVGKTNDKSPPYFTQKRTSHSLREIRLSANKESFHPFPGNKSAVFVSIYFF